MKPIIVKKGWVMYEVPNQMETTYCLYKLQKCGCADSVALYVEADKIDAIDIFNKHIPLLPKGKNINMNGLLIKNKIKLSPKHID
jgi:hypothetical protein